MVIMSDIAENLRRDIEVAKIESSNFQMMITMKNDAIRSSMMLKTKKIQDWYRFSRDQMGQSTIDIITFLQKTNSLT
jgi:hypothetical protein